MAGVAHVCGTGGWAGPLPGDPSSLIGLSATGTYGRIELSWQYPALNPFAVAHTRVYRCALPEYALATLLAIADGNRYIDSHTDNDVGTYYFWVQAVSVNGTYGDLLGPASAFALPSIERMLELLTGRIDSGVLAQALRTEIGKIPLLDQSITAEVQSRIADLGAMSSLVGGIQGGLDQVVVITDNIIQKQSTDNSATVDALNLVAVGYQTAVAGVADSIQVAVDASNVLAAKVTTAETSLYGSTATGEVGLVTHVAGLNGKVTDIGALYTAKVSVDGLIGGFGIYNDGTTVEAGFDVDSFWVGKATNKVKPFIIENGDVFIDELVVRDAAITSAKIAKVIQSDNFNGESDINGVITSNGTNGWAISKAGKAVFNEVAARQSIYGGAMTSYAWPATGTSGYYLGLEGLRIGNQTDNKYVSITADGNFYAPGMSIVDGALTISQANVINTINVAGNAITKPTSAYTAATVSTTADSLVSQTLTIVCDGGPVCIIAGAGITVNRSTTVAAAEVTAGFVLTLSRGTVELVSMAGPSNTTAGSDSGASVGAGASLILPSIVDSPGAGTHTYQLTAVANGSGTLDTLQAIYRSILVIELKR